MTLKSNLMSSTFSESAVNLTHTHTHTHSLSLSLSHNTYPPIIHSYREPQGKGLLEETDLAVPGQDEVDMGQEWPLHETSDVRSYRQFYQSWCGAVQGAYPMTKVDATRVSITVEIKSTASHAV